MSSALAFLPLAFPAASLGLAAAQNLTRGVLAGGGSFAAALMAGMESSPAATQDAAGESSTASLSDLLDQLQQRLASRLQSLGFSTDELSLTLDEVGELQVEGNSDAVSLAEQLLQSDDELRNIAARIQGC